MLSWTANRTDLRPGIDVLVLLVVLALVDNVVDIIDDDDDDDGAETIAGLVVVDGSTVLLIELRDRALSFQSTSGWEEFPSKEE